MTTHFEWMISKDGLFLSLALSVVLQITLAIAVYIRLIRSSGLTVFIVSASNSLTFLTFQLTEAATHIKMRHPKKNFNTFLHIFSLCYQRCSISF